MFEPVYYFYLGVRIPQSLYSLLGSAGPNQEAIFACAIRREYEERKKTQSKGRESSNLRIGSPLRGYWMSGTAVYTWIVVLIFAIVYGWSLLLVRETFSLLGVFPGATVEGYLLRLGVPLLPTFLVLGFVWMLLQRRARKAEERFKEICREVESRRSKKPNDLPRQRRGEKEELPKRK